MIKIPYELFAKEIIGNYLEIEDLLTLDTSFSNKEHRKNYLIPLLNCSILNNLIITSDKQAKVIHSRNIKFTSLRIDNTRKLINDINGDNIKRLLNSRIENINLNDTLIDNYLITYISHICKNISSLSLNNCKNIDNLSIDIISTYCNKLTYLDISNCGNITHKGISYIKNIKTLQYINMNDCVAFDDSCIDTCIELLKFNKPNEVER